MATIKVTQSGTTVVLGKDDTLEINIPGGGTVTVVADPTENVDKIKIEFINDSQADTVIIDLSTFSQDDLHIDIFDYDPSDTIRLVGAFNRYVDPKEEDEYTFDYIGADGQTYSGYVHAKDKNEKDFTAPDSPIIICFAKGTEIETRRGFRAVETLHIGDAVRTVDAGFVPLRWLGRTDLGALDLRRWANLRPVRVKRDAFGPGCPEKDVVLSPNHRVLVSGWQAELCFAESEVLVPIKSLVNGTTIQQVTACSEVSYFHLLLDSHQIVNTSGLLSESLFLGDQSMLAVSEHMHQDLRAVLSEAEWQRHSSAMPVRPLIRARVAQCLAA